MQNLQYEATAKTDTAHWWFSARRATLAALARSVLPLCTEAEVLDIGCCTGGNAAAIADVFTYVGADLSPQAIALARQRFPQSVFLCAQAPDELEFLAQRADLFLLADVLEHVEDDRGMLASLVAQAKDGAHLLITVPADMSLWSRHDESHGHFRRYDGESFARLWQGLPVSVCLLSHFNSRLYWPIRMVRTINRWRGRAYGEADTDLRMPSRPVNWVLERIFAGERRRLLRLLRGQTNRPYRRGVSLIAILRREEGEIAGGVLQRSTEHEAESCAAASS